MKLYLYSVLCVLMVLLCVGCGGDGDAGSDESSQGASGTSGSSDAASKPENMTMDDSMVTADMCMSADPDCPNWFCRCEDGAVVNARLCENGFCSGPGAICPDACMVFGHKSWTGYAGKGAKQEASEPTMQEDMSSGSSQGGNQGSGSSSGEMTCNTSFTSSGTSCDQCADQSCCSEMQACEANTSCLNYWDCHLKAGYSLTECDELYPDGASDYDSLDACLYDSCSYECGL